MSAIVLALLMGGRTPGYEVWRRESPSAQSVFVDSVDHETLSYTLTGLTANTVGYYHIEAVSACGVRSVLPAATRLRRVAMDSANQLIAPAPNTPYGLKLTVGAGGLITASWQYSGTDAEADADGFNVYVATGATPFDYDTIDFAVGLGVKRQALGTFANGTTVRCVVRARTDAGVEETNTREATAVADALAPNPPVTITFG